MATRKRNPISGTNKKIKAEEKKQAAYAKQIEAREAKAKADKELAAAKAKTEQLKKKATGRK